MIRSSKGEAAEQATQGHIRRTIESLLTSGEKKNGRMTRRSRAQGVTMTERTTDTGAGLAVPITSEVLQHKLWFMNEEGAATMTHAFGGSLVVRVTDYDSGICAADRGMSLIGELSGRWQNLMGAVRLSAKKLGSDRSFARAVYDNLTKDMEETS